MSASDGVVERRAERLAFTDGPTTTLPATTAMQPERDMPLQPWIVIRDGRTRLVHRSMRLYAKKDS
jgi:hypothetical protein